MKGIAIHSVIPVRAEAREGAEQNTQMLFGETCQIVETSGDNRWRYVRLDGDGQEGWIDAKMLTPMSLSEYKNYRAAITNAAMVAFPMAYAVSENNGQTIPLTAGTRLTNYAAGRFELLGVGFRIDAAMVITQPLELTEANLMQHVRFFLNTPYLWGGKNALGMDCSGFTQVVMSLYGKTLPRNASEQATCGRAIRDIGNVRAGDLVFFDHEDGKISHVGIILSAHNPNDNTSEYTVIHCSGRVKVEKIDKNGIFSVEKTDIKCPNGHYTHHLVSIRRV